MVVGALSHFAIAPQVNADQPPSLIACDDLTNLTRHRCSSFLRKQTCVRAICKPSFGENAFWFADREARQRLTKGFLANKGRSVLRLGALVAHELLWNHKETEVSHSPTVSRFGRPVAYLCRDEKECLRRE
jgi:hypothetical protein